MNDIISVLGLVFVVLLFNFTYPQSALDLLLRATDYYSHIRQPDNSDAARQHLMCVKGWFYTTDLVQFMLSYFVGIFALLFVFLHVTPLVSVSPLLATTLALGCLLFYVTMIILSWHRITAYNHGSGSMNRKAWLLGTGPDEPFNSKYPIVIFILEVVFSIISLIATAALPFLGFLGVSAEKASLYSLTSAVAATVVAYLINYWGLYVYMPASSISILCEVSSEMGSPDRTASNTENVQQSAPPLPRARGGHSKA
jgi:small-conductance mechanosensitive channel